MQFPFGDEYQFLKSLARIKRETQCEQLVVAWDSWCEWRRIIYSAYKAGSQLVEEQALKEKVYAARDAFLLNLQYIVPCYFAEGDEADDVIAYLVHQMPGKRIIHSTDHDFFQLLFPSVEMHRVRFNPTRTEVVTASNLRELEGFTRRQAVWILAICGCSTDNVPGCRVPKKLVVQVLDQTERFTEVDIHKTGMSILSPGWAKRWDDHFSSGAVDRNLRLVALGHRPLDLLVMYAPNVKNAKEYLQRRSFQTIEDDVLDDLLCAF